MDNDEWCENVIRDNDYISQKEQVQHKTEKEVNINQDKEHTSNNIISNQANEANTLTELNKKEANEYSLSKEETEQQGKKEMVDESKQKEPITPIESKSEIISQTSKQKEEEEIELQSSEPKKEIVPSQSINKGISKTINDSLPKISKEEPIKSQTKPINNNVLQDEVISNQGYIIKETPKDQSNNQKNQDKECPKHKLIIQTKTDYDYYTKEHNYIQFIDLKGKEAIDQFFVFDSQCSYAHINTLCFVNCNLLRELEQKEKEPTPSKTKTGKEKEKEKDTEASSTTAVTQPLAPSSRLNEPIKLKYINSCPEFNESLNDLLPFPINSDNNPNFQLLSLKIEKSNVITSEYNNLMADIVKEDRIRKNIRYMSFAENQIVTVDFKKYSWNNEKKFNALEELNFYGNRIYCFKLSYIKAVIPKTFKYINLIDNQFSSFTELDMPKAEDGILCLLNKNLLLTIESNLKKYKEYLDKVIKNYTYLKFKCMSMSGLFLDADEEGFNKYIINGKNGNLNNLTQLDLSYCGLKSENVFSFFNNHKTMINLKRLNLRTNAIDHLIFNIKGDNEEPAFKQLKELNLSNNSIVDQTDYKFVFDFIKAHDNLIHLDLQVNPFGKSYTLDNNVKKNKNEIQGTNKIESQPQEPDKNKKDKGTKNKDKKGKDKEETKGKSDIKETPSVNKNICISNETVGNSDSLLPVYTTKEILNNLKEAQYNFVRLVKEIYELRPAFELDFSTESRLFVYSEIKKKNGSYDIRVKHKKNK